MVMMTLPTAIVAVSDMEESFGETVTHAGFSDNGMFLITNEAKFKNVGGSTDEGRKLWDELNNARSSGKEILWGTGRYDEGLTLEGFNKEIDKEYRKAYRLQ